ncbi:MAG: hypothetical protein GXO89_02060 [Chlorobi bacterium]|nr:hypothetical protein [Chlorobiota bacterium]
MKIKNLLAALAILIFFGQQGFSQDLIVKKNQDTIFCKIKEVATDDIKYSLPEYPDDLRFSIEKEKVNKAVFSNGKEMVFVNELSNPENYIGQKKNAIKIDFMSPLTGNTTFAFEHSLKPGRSIEGTLGIIGLGIDPNEVGPRGAFLKFGMKFIKSPDFYLRGMRYAHILKGAYVKPEISLGYYSKLFEYHDYSGSYNYIYSIERQNVFTGAFHLDIGKQWVFDDAFLLDFFFGLGYGFATYPKNSYSDPTYQFGYIILSEEVPISLSAGLKIGFLFK